MNAEQASSLQRELAALVPNLRAFARSLSGSSDTADDLVQEALVKAWSARSSFAEGTNLKAWLFTILRNTFLSQKRKQKWEAEDVDGEGAARLSVKAGQPGHMDMIDFQRAFSALPSDQREALLLIGAEGFSYEDAALMCGCAVGTMKSRVNRARTRLAQALGYDSATYELQDAHVGATRKMAI